tara:strand:+ start:10006 stop:10203 length:198 start_codon:yes stop_codon:yes gene_type:complete
MTRKELELLKINESSLNPIVNRKLQIITYDYNIEDDDYCVKIGRAKYYNFGEAQALLNDLEKHIQ